ncbi:MAG: hypothetical protein R3336_04305, partial [Phycisphaeraceae bacterium]|nr:hypothetical protein [Phycisphaeraceae bacterium]
MTRASYARELQTAMVFPLAAALIEGGVVGILARKAFGAGPVIFATLMAAPMFANLTSVFWARLARGRPKVRMIIWLKAGLLLALNAIALLPTTINGAVMLTALVVIARCLAAGIITIRSTVWRMNYSRSVRARITSRLTLIHTLLIAGGPLLGYALLDFNSDLFRLLYPLGALIAVFGVDAFSKIRLRREPELLRREQADDEGTTGGGHGFFEVLRTSPLFTRYLGAQFVAGISNMMSEVALVYAIAVMTEGIAWEYVISIALTTTIPKGMATVSLPLWGRLLGRMHVSLYRTRQGVFWVLAQAGNWIAITLMMTDTRTSLLGGIAVLALARIAQGIARGGGMLAWQIGHHDFASAEKSTAFMGVHQTLTGIRGAIAPFAAMALYAGAFQWAGIGHHLFLFTTVLAALAIAGYWDVYRRVKA